MGGGLLERDAALGALIAAVVDAVAGRGSVVLVSGEAGIGKTSVIRAFLADLDQAVGRPVRVLGGACDDLITRRPLGPLRDAARGTGGPLEQALDDDTAEPVFGAAVAELERPPVTVLIVEDVHWIDDATLDVLRHLARRIEDVPGVVVLTFRADEVGVSHPLRALLGELAGSAVRRVPLEPLSAPAVTALVRRAAEGTADAGPPTDGRALHALTGGNPFFVTEALAAPAGEVPGTVADAVVARLGQLDLACRQACEQLAVVPTQVDFELAERLVGDLHVLDEAETRGVLEVRTTGLAFRHELARRAIEASLPAIRRRRLNRAVVAALLAQRRLDLDRLVHHAIQADDAETIAAHAPAAGGEAARLGSHRQALAHFEVALRHADRLDPPERARLHDDYAWELYNARRFGDAVTSAREAVRRYEALDDSVALAEALVRLSRHLYMTGATNASESAVVRAVEVLSRADARADARAGADTDAGTGPASGARPDALAYALANHGSVLALTERSSEALDVLTRARALAVGCGRRDLVAMCLNYLGVARADLHGAVGLTELRESLALAVAADLDEYAARGYTNLAEHLYRFGRLDELDDCLRAGLTFCREHGFWSHAYNLDVHRQLLAIRRGDWATAEAGLRDLVSTHDDAGMLYVYSVPPYARLLARRGRPEAGPLLAEAWRRATEQRSLLGLAQAGIGLVERAWLTGRPEDALPVADVLLSRRDRAGAAPVIAEVLRYLDRAGIEVSSLPECPEPWAAGLRGDWQSAARGWAEIGDRYEQALELAASGAVEPTLTALRLLDDLGAEAAAALVRERLAELGVSRIPRGPATTTRANPAGLTDRQLAVLALVADGLTNAEIAARLVLSVRTVDHHVAAVFEKLGVRTRREAAVAARELNVPGTGE